MSRRARLSREGVVEAAACLMDAAGSPDSATLAELAAHLGVKAPSLYNHVDGLDDLRDAVTVYTYEQFYETIRDAAVGKAADDALMAIAFAARCFAKQHPGLYPLLLPAARAGSAQAQRIIDLFLTVLGAYHLTEDDALHAIRALRSVLHGFVDIERVGGFGLPLDLDESYRRLVAMLIDSLHRR